MVKKLYRIGPVVLGAAVLFVLPGCGGGSAEPDATTQATATDDASAKLQAELDAIKAQNEALEAEKADLESKVQAGRRKPTVASSSGVSDNAVAPVVGAPGEAKPDPVQQDPRADAATSVAPPATQPGVNERTAADKARTAAAANAGPSIIEITPETLDLGIIPTGTAETGSVTLKNIGDEPRTLKECKPACGCTTTKCPKGKILNPGDSVEIELKLDGGQAQKKLQKRVSFFVAEEPAPLIMQIKAEAVSYVTIEPATLDKGSNPDGRIVLKSIDDEPFTIKSIYPPIIDEFPQEPKTEHEVLIDWEKLAEQAGNNRKLLFALDHPKCSKAYGTVSPQSLPRAAPPGPGPNPARGANNIEQMLKSGQEDRVLAMVNDGTINVDAIDGSGKVPLGAAAIEGSIPVMQALLDASADIEATDSTGRTPIMYAAQSKNAEAVVIMLDAGASVHARDQIGNTALCWAAAFGDAPTVGELLDAGAGVDVAGSATGFTPLIWAAGFGQADSVKLLVDAGANLEAVDAFEKATPLMYAARTNRKDNCAVLIEAGGDLEARDAVGKTVFLMAAANGGADAEMIQFLVEAEVDVNARTAAGENALDLALNRTDVRAEAVVAALRELGLKETDPNAPAEGGGGGE